MHRTGGRSADRAGWSGWSRRGLVLAVLVVLALGTASAPTANGQAFQPLPPADPPAHRAAPCRPAAPAVEKTPGVSVRVDRGPAECHAVSLSFDNGADRGYAEQILDILKEEQVPVSFGMTGAWAQSNPDLTQRIVDEGHELINHTWAHRSFTGFSAGRPLAVGERRLELERTEAFLVETFGRSPKPLFRPPYGDLDPGVLKDVADAGYDYTIMWTIDSLGWNGLKAPGIVQRVLGRVEPGAIVLFHVGIQSEDALALKAIIGGLREQGYVFVNITDLLGL
ncbi:MAG: polysaccharide deacetylase family protein [Chloroflexota bacterium]